MTRLLRENIKRMIKHPALWVCVALQIILTFIMTVKAKATPSFNYRLDAAYFMSISFWGFAYTEIMVFVMGTLILGGDYQNNTLRNKLILGYSRESVFFSQFITLLTASLIMFFARLLFFCAFSIPLLKSFAFRSEYLWAVFFQVFCFQKRIPLGSILYIAVFYGNVQRVCYFCNNAYSIGYKNTRDMYFGVSCNDVLVCGRIYSS